LWRDEVRHFCNTRATLSTKITKRETYPRIAAFSVKISPHFNGFELRTENGP